MARGDDMGQKYNVNWLVFLQFAILFVLYFTPGSSYSAIWIYLSQLYLLLTILSRSPDRLQLRSAVALTIMAAISAVIAAYASRQGVTGTWDVIIANLHFGIITAVAVTMLVSCNHIWSTIA